MEELEKGEKRKSDKKDDVIDWVGGMIESEEETKKELEPHVKKMKSMFAKQDLVIVVEGHELHVDKTELIEKSPVFRTMLTAEFKEKNAERIELPEQNLEHFLMFLRCTLSAIGDEINLSDCRKIVPVAHYYQVETILIKAEKLLTDECTRLGIEDQSSGDIIEKILFAEKYQLKKYLESLIKCASRKMFCFFSRAKGYQELSQKTLNAIAMKRWSDNINPTDGKPVEVNPWDGTLVTGGDFKHGKTGVDLIFKPGKTCVANCLR